MLPSYSSNRGACSHPTPVIEEHAPLLFHGVGEEHALLWSRRGDPLLWSRRGACSPPTQWSRRGACSPPTPWSRRGACYPPTGVIGEHALLLLQ